MAYLIVELGDAEQWAPAGFAASKVIPPNRRPTMLQPDRETAEREAVRLAGRHPDRRFVVFAPVAVGLTAKVPTHVNLAGKVIVEKSVAALAMIEDPEELPF